MQVIELDMYDICSESVDRPDSEQARPSQENQDCHSADPADVALLLATSQDDAGTASPARWPWTTVSHRQLAAHNSLVGALELGKQDVVLTQTSPAELLGVYQLALSLYAGASMVPVSAADAHEMVSALAEHHVTVCLVTVDELQDWLHAGLSSQACSDSPPSRFFLAL